MKKKTKKYMSYWISIILAISVSWFIWKTWDRVDKLLGGGNTPYLIVGGFIVLMIVIGHFSFKKLVRKIK